MEWNGLTVVNNSTRQMLSFFSPPVSHGVVSGLGCPPDIFFSVVQCIALLFLSMGRRAAVPGALSEVPPGKERARKLSKNDKTLHQTTMMLGSSKHLEAPPPGVEWHSSSGGTVEQTEAKRERKILLGRCLGPVLPEGGADRKIGGGIIHGGACLMERKEEKREQSGRRS